MSASTRDRRATLYPYVGHNRGGFVKSAYGDSRGTFFCRFSPIPGEETMLDMQAGISARATIEFADEAPVAEHDLIVMDDDVQWKAGPITPRKAQRALILQVERNNEMAELPVGVAAPAVPDEIIEAGHGDEDFEDPSDDPAFDGGDSTTATFDETNDGGGA